MGAPVEEDADSGASSCVNAERCDGASERCRVIVRLRPLPDGERECPLKIVEGERILAPGGGLGTPSKATPRKRKGMHDDDPAFHFDKVFAPDCKQEDVFGAVLNDSVSSVLEGFNATVLAYGQTGAGKTYNMFGGEDEASRGIIPRALDEIFARISQDQTGSNFEVKLSMTEIYMEELIDLLRPSSAFHRLRLRESVFAGVWVEGLNHVAISSSKSALELVKQGMSNRTVGATNMNDASSRSHCVVSLRVEKSLPDGMVQTGVLHFADLAGMERVDRTGAQGQTLEEAKKINLSLSALGNCISALSDPSRTHVPFRDAKLTFLLKNSLGGNAKTTLLVACSSRQKDIDETMGALRFGQRARAVRNLVKVNRKLSALELQRLLDKLQQEHKTLQTYCLSLEEQVKAATMQGGCSKENMTPQTGAGSTGGSPNVAGSLSSPIARPKPPRLSSIKSPPALPMSPAQMMSMSTPKGFAASNGGEPSPARGMDPMVLLHRISVLEAERVDMQIEIEALSTFSPPGGVAGTSVSRDAAGTQRLSWGADTSMQTSMLFTANTPDKKQACEACTQVSPIVTGKEALKCLASIEMLRGTLSKRGRSFLGLRRAVGCELTETSLIYESSQSGVRKEIQLGLVSSCHALPGGRGFRLELEGKGRRFVFSASSEKERERWLCALSERGVQVPALAVRA